MYLNPYLCTMDQYFTLSFLQPGSSNVNVYLLLCTLCRTLKPSLSLSASCVVMVTGLLLRGVIISLCISSDNFLAQSLIGDAVVSTHDDLSGNELGRNSIQS